MHYSIAMVCSALFLSLIELDDFCIKNSSFSNRKFDKLDGLADDTIYKNP